VAATFEKANTYVFAAPIIRDREVGGSNPLAPTNNLHLIKYLRSLFLGTVFACGQFVAKIFRIRECTTTKLVLLREKPPENVKR
jgi:hypothetical protein